MSGAIGKSKQDARDAAAKVFMERQGVSEEEMQDIAVQWMKKGPKRLLNELELVGWAHRELDRSRGVM